MNTQEEPILASDKLRVIQEWLDYMNSELEKEQIDFVELSEIDRVHKITKEQE